MKNDVIHFNNEIQGFHFIYCRSGNIREVLIFTRFAKRTNSFKNVAIFFIIIALLKKINFREF